MTDATATAPHNSKTTGWWGYSHLDLNKVEAVCRAVYGERE